MSIFKQGDAIRCINANSVGEGCESSKIYLGQEYYVASYYNNLVRLVGVEGWFGTGRFELVSQSTSGHLSSNGGIRGHSAGSYFPYRVMAQGTLDDITWWVMAPDGTKLIDFENARDAVTMAHEYKRLANEG